MSFSIRQLNKVAQLADEVAALARSLEHEGHQGAKALIGDPEWAKHHDRDEYPWWLTMTGTRRSGELRRRSMDLTRALADLRRP